MLVLPGADGYVFQNSWGGDWDAVPWVSPAPVCHGCHRAITTWQAYQHGRCRRRPGHPRARHYVPNPAEGEALEMQDRQRRTALRGALANIALADGLVHAGYGDLASMHRVGVGHFRPSKYRLHCINGVFVGEETAQAPTCIACTVRLG